MDLYETVYKMEKWRMMDDVKILNVKSGDVLVFRTDMVLDQTQVDDLSNRLIAKFAALNLDVNFLILACGFQLSILRTEKSGLPVSKVA